MLVTKCRKTDVIIQKPKTQNQNEDNQAMSSRLRDLPEWLEEFTDNLEDTEVPASAHISHDSEPERHMNVASRKHSVCTHFPKDRNCEVCKRTNITRAPCRRRNGEPVPQAEKCGDLRIAGHKVLNEGSEARNNHRHAIVVQDLATQWIQPYSCKTQTSQETERGLQKFSSRRKSRKSFTLTIYWHLANLVKTNHGSIVRRHSIDLRQMAWLKEWYAE